MPYSVKSFLKSLKYGTDSADVGDTFHTESKIEDLFCGAPSASEPSLFFGNYHFGLGFKPVQDDFQHDFARMTNEADSL